jgi:DNA repair exonuclease SbcCD ATPase subunit
MNINTLLGIAKFSAIFIALCQGLLISNLRSEKLDLTQKLNSLESQQFAYNLANKALDKEKESLNDRLALLNVELENKNRANATIGKKKEESDDKLNKMKIALENKNTELENQLRELLNVEIENKNRANATIDKEKKESDDKLNKLKTALENKNTKLKNRVDELNNQNKNLNNRLQNQRIDLKSKDKVAAIGNKLLKPDYFKSLVIGKSRLAVMRVLGDPDERIDYYFGNQPVSAWTYNNRIEHPGSALDGNGHSATIRFDDRVVDSVEFGGT